MLANLHVKNFAIIDEIDVDFGKHLNILTGETGAGKSIIVGSIGIALGARVSSEIIGNHGDSAMVEVVFQIDDKGTIDELKSMDIDADDGQIVISRKITENRSINKINGQSVSVSEIKKVASLCIDIHGQHEHQSLLSTDKHMEILDEFASDKIGDLKSNISDLYKDYQSKLKRLNEADISSEERAKELSYLSFVKQEIELANILPGEIEQLEEQYKKASNSGKIVEALSDVYSMTSREGISAVSSGLRRLNEVKNVDDNIIEYASELEEIENLLSDFNRNVSMYMDDFSFDESELIQLERRLDMIRGLQAKYGESYEAIMDYLKDVEEKLEKLDDIEGYIEKCKAELEEVKNKLLSACDKLTSIRKEAALVLEKNIADALEDLNFAHVDFEISISPRENASSNGMDEIEFLIATNPGEERRSLSKVASGGELSRIMLAIKTVLADADKIETLIFDEIDTGISGRTAQKVSEKMSVIGNKHQIICITHLAQIAAMADSHFVIEKSVDKTQSATSIRRLTEDESIDELARILGGVEVTDSAVSNAKEMKSMAKASKKY